MKTKSHLGFFIGGPSASATVYDKDHIEPIIKTLCEITGDDPEDYTATDLEEPGVVFEDLSKHFDTAMEHADGIFREADELFKKADKLFR